MSSSIRNRLRSLRRQFHRYPEPAWCEFRTTSLLVELLEEIGVDELAIGTDALVSEERMAVPSEEEIELWYQRAHDTGARADVLEQTAGGHTGVVAKLTGNEDEPTGPHVGLRVDIDGLFIEESTSDNHVPATEGFRSEHEETMHACGHDAHMTIGLGVIEAIQQSDFDGTLTVFFQPAEEVSGGGKPMAESDHMDAIEHLFAVHVGLDHPTGTVVGGIVKPLAMSHITAQFTGTPAHAGKSPNEGNNAMQAMVSAIQNVYAISRHEDGMTRVNIGRAECGTASNIIAEEATIHGEVRGETTELMEYMRGECFQTLDAAATMHGCSVDPTVISESPRADSDETLATLVCDVASLHEHVDTPVVSAEFGASEDATFLMNAVQRAGGYATYAIIGTDHPTSHHTPTFDVDEQSIEIGVDVLSESIQRIEEVRSDA
ncbi:amidohydrolase [Halocatena marina]|uniref:Amidohydrolase n=1 Tax=Halocatena marina TaxID=2934937 RepID=A0ABD5YKL2_9EURY|nr:amidohydrolase [Halocatena marina]